MQSIISTHTKRKNEEKDGDQKYGSIYKEIPHLFFKDFSDKENLSLNVP